MKEFSKEQKRLFEDFSQSMASRPISVDKYDRFNVKRGLRNSNGTGVLVGLTRVGEVFSYYMDDGERLPVEGHLYYNGIALRDLVLGFYEDKRFGYEETAYLLLFGELPDRDQLVNFEKCWPIIELCPLILLRI